MSAGGKRVATDPIARVKDRIAAGEAAPVIRDHADAGDFVSPVPAGAPEPSFRHKALGAPTAAPWRYEDADGRTLFYVARFDKADGTKEVLPYGLWRAPSGLGWRWKGIPAPRTLYGLRELAERPDAAVLVVEGEKTANTVRLHFPALAAVTWQGGSNAIGKADWTALAGRRVVIWPDADDAGARCAEAASRAALAAGAALAGVVALPDGLPKGWDLADAWPDGLDRARAARLIDEALGGRQAAVAWPAGYVMNAEGFWLERSQISKVRNDETGELETVVSKSLERLGGPFEVLGEARDPNGSGWSLVIEFRDRDGRAKTEIVSRGKIATAPGEVRGRLAAEGLFIAIRRRSADNFLAALAEVSCARRQTLVGATGWLPGDRFALPTRVLGPPGSEPVLFTGERGASHQREKGTLAAWKAEVAAPARGNPHLVLAISIAFSGPLLRLVQMEGCGFHFRGPSSGGKTTLAIAAGSVWGGGGPLGAAHSWRTTANALEQLAFSNSETCLVLDEIGMVAPEEAGQAAYSLSMGQSKARARTDGELRARPEWLTNFISTGEISLADHIRSSVRSSRPMIGQDLRLLDIAADAGRGLGVWDRVPACYSPAEFSDRIRDAAKSSYGVAGPAFVERLVADRPEAVQRIKLVITAFLADAQKDGDTGQVHRVAMRFALTAAAGELAARFGVVPWRPGEASAAALVVFQRWASRFGRAAPREEQDVLRTLKAVIESQQSRFAATGDAESGFLDPDQPPSHRAGEARSLTTLGYVHTLMFDRFYLFHDGGWREVFKGFDATHAAKVVLAAGYLEKGDGKHLKKAKSMGQQNQRFYWVRASILTHEFDD